jgi:DNA-binding GntR family transcriptional regulator
MTQSDSPIADNLSPAAAEGPRDGSPSAAAGDNNSSSAFDSYHITNSSMVDFVVENLRQAIVSGNVEAGSRLIEADLSVQFGVSRGPIRDALKRLEGLGLVTLRPNRGAVVRIIKIDDVMEVYFLRSSLGVIAIRNLIGAGLVDDDLSAGLTLLEGEARKSRNKLTQTRVVAMDLAFQSAVVDACGFPRVASLFAETTDEVKLFVINSGIRYPYLDAILEDHSNLLHAILESNTPLAVSLWRERMRTAVDEFVSLVPDGEILSNNKPWLKELL